MGTLGSYIATLRALRGWSLSVTAARAGVSAEALVRAEADNGELSTYVALAGLFGVDLAQLRKGAVGPPPQPPPTSVFRFHTDRTALHADDLPVLRDALHAGRRWIETPTGRAGLARRAALRPASVSGPAPTDAAKQGHQLARAVRANLGLGGDRVGDLRALVEEHLGVTVVVRRLRSRALRAAAALDAERAGASIVLGARPSSTAGRLVEIAHELCHLLFDPAPPGAVQVALDGEGAWPEFALRESRARGFAAELLLPALGLREILGEPSLESDGAAAQALILKAMRHFGTSWEITANHLHNLGYLSHLAWEEVRYRRVPAPASGLLTLPGDGETPLCLRTVTSTAADGAQVAEAAWRTATTVREEVATDAAARAAPYLQRAVDFTAAGRPMRGGVALSQAVDDAVRSGDLALAEAILTGAGAAGLRAEELVGLLGTTFPLRAVLDEARAALLRRMADRAVEQGWTPSEVDEARAQLA
jgi:Zn-dependent peptidase ImmA (M78 family)/transcriptional regulator with XRE-family HTH domain